jgi:hypothetical protein
VLGIDKNIKVLDLGAPRGTKQPPEVPEYTELLNRSNWEVLSLKLLTISEYNSALPIQI